MSSLMFGSHLDLHSGGIDLQFPHHTNEIAQCEAHQCIPHDEGWVTTFMHSGHLHIEGRKMSKSLVMISDVAHSRCDIMRSSSVICLFHMIV